MRKRIYFITRSYPNVGASSGGGALARAAQVIVLENLGFEVIVIVPNPNGKTFEKDNVIHIGFKWNKKYHSVLERFGFIVDTYENWSLNILKYLENKITKNDFVIGVTGGSADTFNAAFKLKQKHGCNLVLSYHDPINYTEVNGLYVNSKIHSRRNKFEAKIVNSADLIFSSSLKFRDRLLKKFNLNENKVANFYFGYNVIEAIENKNYSTPFSIAYAGSFNIHQSPEILYLITENIKINKLFLGYYNHYFPIQKYINEKEFKGALNHNDFLEFAKKNIDIGFVSLTSEYLSVCFPSKIFEYINLGLPMLAALPNGDAMDLINELNIGKAFHYSDIDGMRNYLTNLTSDELKIQRENIIKIKENYYFGNTLIGMGEYLKKIQ